MDGGDLSQRLGAEENVARYVGGMHFDPTTGQVNGSAFERTRKDHDGVSVTRRGIFSNDEAEDRAAIRKVTSSRLKLGKMAVFAELNVGNALESLAEFEQEVYFAADPLEAKGEALANPAHALLIGFPFLGEQVGSLTSELAGDRLRQCIHDRFPATMPSASA